MSDFFALEAGEYLERLDALLNTTDTPNADELVRLARALRGSALMGNQAGIARAAAGLHALAPPLPATRPALAARPPPPPPRPVGEPQTFGPGPAPWPQPSPA